MDSSWAQKVDMIHIEQQFYKLNLFSTQVVWFEVTIKDPEDDYYDYEYGLGELFHPLEARLTCKQLHSSMSQWFWRENPNFEFSPHFFMNFIF